MEINNGTTQNGLQIPILGGQSLLIGSKHNWSTAASWKLPQVSGRDRRALEQKMTGQTMNEISRPRRAGRNLNVSINYRANTYGYVLGTRS